MILIVDKLTEIRSSVLLSPPTHMISGLKSMGRQSFNLLVLSIISF